MKKEAIIVVPGGDGHEVGFALNRLINKLSQNQNVATVSKLPDSKANKQSFNCHYVQQNTKKQFDVFEAYWGDIINSYNPSEFKPIKKAFWGIELMTYWLKSVTFKATHKNRFIFVGICLSIVLLVAWYISIIGLLGNTFHSSTLYTTLADTFGWSKDHISVANSPFWLLLASFFGLVQFDIVLHIAGFTMKFMKSPPLRETIKDRIHKVVQPLLDSDEYDRITIFSHSLGSLPTFDYLADLKNTGATKVRCVSAGASISFFTDRSKELQERLELCINNPAVTEWVDFFSHEDWMCSYKRVDEYDKPNFKSVDIDFDTSWLTRFNKKIHSQYFDDKRVMEQLLISS